MTSSNQTYRSGATITILRVRTIEIDGQPHVGRLAEFDSPELLARASEGFCPFRLHQGAEPEDQLFRVEPQADGTVVCLGPKRRRMEWEWVQE